MLLAALSGIGFLGGLKAAEKPAQDKVLSMLQGWHASRVMSNGSQPLPIFSEAHHSL